MNKDQTRENSFMNLCGVSCLQNYKRRMYLKYKPEDTFSHGHASGGERRVQKKVEM